MPRLSVLCLVILLAALPLLSACHTVAGAVVFSALIFTMHGRWSPASARADAAAHDADVDRELAQESASF